jgi:hypothetical protein
MLYVLCVLFSFSYPQSTSGVRIIRALSLQLGITALLSLVSFGALAETWVQGLDELPITLSYEGQPEPPVSFKVPADRRTGRTVFPLLDQVIAYRDDHKAVVEFKLPPPLQLRSRRSTSEPITTILNSHATFTSSSMEKAATSTPSRTQGLAYSKARGCPRKRRARGDTTSQRYRIKLEAVPSRFSICFGHLVITKNRRLGVCQRATRPSFVDHVGSRAEWR